MDCFTTTILLLVLPAYVLLAFILVHIYRHKCGCTRNHEDVSMTADEEYDEQPIVTMDQAMTDFDGVAEAMQEAVRVSVSSADASLVLDEGEMPADETFEALFDMSAEDVAAQEIVCHICGKEYQHQQTLDRHLNLECGRQKSQRCIYCEYATKRKFNLKIHVRGQHGALFNDWLARYY